MVSTRSRLVINAIIIGLLWRPISYVWVVGICFSKSTPQSSTSHFLPIRLSWGLYHRTCLLSGSGQASGGTSRRWAPSVGRLHGSSSIKNPCSSQMALSTGLPIFFLGISYYLLLLIITPCYYELWGTALSFPLPCYFVNSPFIKLYWVWTC